MTIGHNYFLISYHKYIVLILPCCLAKRPHIPSITGLQTTRLAKDKNKYFDAGVDQSKKILYLDFLALSL